MAENYLFEKKYFLAGEDKTRLADFENAFYDKNIHCVLALRGGEGCMRLLDKIDYQKIKENPKVLFGFSDITALQNALWKKAKLQSTLHLLENRAPTPPNFQPSSGPGPEISAARHPKITLSH